MKDVRLQKLIGRNFQGGSFEMTPEGNNIDVHGTNGTGKTRIASAFSWLLFNKDSLGRADFDIKNRNSEGDQEHGIEHSVEAIFLISAASTITLKKVYKEIWTKQRGKAQAVFSGNTTDHYINGIPVQQKEYNERVSDIAGDESLFRLLTSPTAFPALHWTKQRALLLDVCGDITDAQVIESDGSLAPLLSVLGKYSLEDYKKIVTARRTEINKQLTAIPVRIDEVKRGLPDTSGLDRNLLKDTISNLEASLDETRLRLSGIDNGSTITELSRKAAIIDADIKKMERDYFNDAMGSITKLNAQINEINESKIAHERKSKSLTDAISDKKNALVSLENSLSLLREKWRAIDAEQFQNTTEDTCPACGQSLPAERVEAARTSAFAEFNRKKAERLTEIDVQGKSKKDEKTRIENEIEVLQKDILELPAFESVHDLGSLVAERDSLKILAEDYSRIPGRGDLINSLSEIENEIKIAKESMSVDRSSVKEDIANITDKLSSSKANLDKFALYELNKKRIDELKGEEKTLTAEYEKLERELYLCESFIKAKVKLLTDRINSKFEIVRFKLFDNQVNGGISECCEITVNGVGYNSGLNSAAKINAGIDIIRTLQHHFGLSAPIFVDNAESVVNLLRPDCQIIRLIVSEPDKVLRVETEKRTAKAA